MFRYHYSVFLSFVLFFIGCFAQSEMEKNIAKKLDERINYFYLENNLDSKKLIEKIYLNILERNPSEQDLMEYAKFLYKQKSVGEVVLLILLSEEFYRKFISDKTMGEGITQIYLKFVGRVPNQDELLAGREKILSGKGWRSVALQALQQGKFTFLL